jgi:diguanylate cyclase (GGDEF)-like protein
MFRNSLNIRTSSTTVSAGAATPAAPAWRRFAPRGLQARVLALFLLLIVVVQVGGLALVSIVGGSAARRTVGSEVVAGSRVFERLVEQDTGRLLQGARLMTSDYAFREVIATGDHATIVSALVNYGKRINAPLLMVVDLDRVVVGDTQEASVGQAFAFPKLLASAESAGQASALGVLQGRLYQLVVVPVLAPMPIAWAVIGQQVDDAWTLSQRRLTGLDVTFVSREAGGSWIVQASTLDAAARPELVANIAAQRFDVRDVNGNAAYAAAAITRVMRLPSSAGGEVLAVLQEPVATALEPFHRLQRLMVLIALLGVVVSVVASVLIARGIARPVRDLARVAVRIAAGDYATAPPPSGIDEIRDLGRAFNAMQAGIAGRETRIMDLAYRDALTGLPNRAAYHDRVDAARADAAAQSSPVAVLLMDLDHFKDVNGTLGHPIGDIILRVVATRIAAALERPTDMVARLGGDEFAVLLPGDDAVRAERVAGLLLRALEAPVTADGHVVDVRASIGIAVFPMHGRERATLLRHADIAMYAAKRDNLGFAVWDAGHAEHGKDRLSLMSGLRKAVEHDELVLFYQPIIAAAAPGAHHAESLVRWWHPTRGLVQPNEFVPFAEQTGYIRSITQWVMAHAIKQCAAWRREGVAIDVSINLSARDLVDAALAERFAALLQLHGCASSWITLELTESAILDDPDHGIESLRRLHALGCRLAIDDYGTGYSSLAYLRRLPVHELKLDKTFIVGMAHNPGDAVIVRSTIDLAHNLGLTVVAEGVEDEATLERLRALGCDRVQGYLVAKPLAAADVANWMRTSPWARGARDGAPLLRVI